MKEIIKKISEGQSLTIEEARAAAEKLLSGEATQAQIGAYLTALRMKGETLEEIIGSAMVLRDKAEHIFPKVENYIDFVGTGGDGSNSFNISTTSAFVCAGAGLPVAKHGNRAISSKSGAGDCLEALGVNILAEPGKVEKEVEEVGIGFMFAPAFNKSMRFVGQARAEMGIRSIFNILGPLANPSGAKRQLIGVYSPKLTEVIAKALYQLGVERALVVSSVNGMDEISTAEDTHISELKNGKVTTYFITPEQYGFRRVATEELKGADGKENAEITKAVLSGKEKGAKRDIVLLNAGAACYIGGMAGSIEEGIQLAKETIDSGRAMEKLETLVEFSNK